MIWTFVNYVVLLCSGV